MNGQLHCAMANNLAHSLLGIDHRGNRRFKYCFGFCIRLDHPALQMLIIAHQPLGAVGINAVEIGKQENIGDNLCLLAVETEFLENIVAELLEILILEGIFSHNEASCFKIY